uniref:2-dehydro-3-deoxyphosphooctonate aldolase n=1 Tax=Flavobacterium sp. TaxID=239 RepID=UPI00404ACC35
MKRILKAFICILLFQSCTSTKNTIKNIDENAPTPILENFNTFELNTISTNKKYGYDPDYPINVFYVNTKNDTLNCSRFLNALAGPNQEQVFYKRLESCCPFPSKQSKIGAGFLEVYEVYWDSEKPKKLYFNIYEKGILEAPVGFTIKKKK